MATERTSKVVEGEMESLKEKIRSLEAKKQAHAKGIEKARTARKAGAFRAHVDGDKQAADALAKSRENELRAVMESEDIGSAISTGRTMFAKLESEWKRALNAEQWAALMAEAEQARKEAGLIDQAMAALATLMGQHGKRLDTLKRHSHNLGIERAFGTVGLRHVERIFAWRLIQQGVEFGQEKPSAQYREATGYAAIFGEQVAAAKATYEIYNKEREADGQGGDSQAAGPESEAGAEAGAGPG